MSKNNDASLVQLSEEGPRGHAADWTLIQDMAHNQGDFNFVLTGDDSY